MAHKRFEGMLGRDVPQAEFGKLVADAMERPEPYSQGRVAEWFNKGVRDADTLWAIAKVTGANAAWLAFEEGEPFPAMITMPQLQAYGEATVEDAPRARRVAEPPPVMPKASFTKPGKAAKKGRRQA